MFLIVVPLTVVLIWGVVTFSVVMLVTALNVVETMKLAITVVNASVSKINKTDSVSEPVTSTYLLTR